MTNIKKWFEFVKGLSIADSPLALSRQKPAKNHPVQETLPKARLPHLNPREALIYQYVLKPRQTISRLPAAAPLSLQEPARPNPLTYSAQPRFNSSSSTRAPSPQKVAASALAESAAQTEALARSAATLEDLRKVVENYEGCSLKKLANTTVFGQGNPSASLMLVGEAPGAEEDARGLPFVGLSGQLLDRMLKAIGLPRTEAYITNIIPWRPPANRQPSPAEVALCLPFVRRHIELIRPKLLVCVGGTAAKALLGTTEGIMRLRGRWIDFQTENLTTPIPCTAIFHPAYLLRSPGQKREAWRDLLNIQETLQTLEGAP